MENSPAINTPENKVQKYLLVAWDFLKIIIIAAIIVFPIRYFLFQPFVVNGESMSPNLHTGDYLIIDEFSYRLSEPKRGDVVVLKFPLDESQRFIKRIIGLPGETVEIKDGRIGILKDGKLIALNEKDYLSPDLQTEGSVYITLEQGRYFVLGDNRNFSFDSRRWGQS
ncbi:MAG: signal peptidase I, partial [Patescibacteria group bacterium]